MSTKRKQPTKVVAPTIKASAKPVLKAKIDDSKTSVLAGASIPSSANEPIDISSDSDSDDDDLELTDDEALDEQLEAGKTKQVHNGVAIKTKDADIEMQNQPHPTAGENTDDSDASEGEPDVPTFGDMIRAHETIDVAGSSSTLAQAANGNSLVPAQNQLRIIAPPSTSSLGTVLNQALRTDDTDLLESCLQTADLTTVRNTIQRMDSDLAAALLGKLAARMHRRPGRAHSLMSWVQWTLVAHGGALAHQDDIVRKLSELNRVLDERARGLNSLLSLKGKLDMLEAQMQLRRDNKGRGVRRRGAQDESDYDEEEGEEDEEEGIIYVEGEEDEEPSALMNGLPNSHEEDDEFPLSNGIEDSEDSDADSDDEVDMDEPELTDRESLDADEVDHEDVDESADEDDSDVEPAPPTKLRKKGAAAFTKRK